jgi:chaperonin cofactor prefoldin
MKQFTTEFDAFKSNHASDVKELNKVKAEKVELERRLDGTKVELEKANSQASMWQKKYEKLQNVMKDALGETT